MVEPDITLPMAPLGNNENGGGMRVFRVAAICFAMLVLTAWSAHADVKILDDQPCCDDKKTLPLPFAMEVSWEGTEIVIKITSAFNCADQPGNPRFNAYQGNGTLSVTSKSPSGWTAACLCPHKVSYSVSGAYPGLKTIYYVQDGMVLGHAAVP